MGLPFDFSGVRPPSYQLMDLDGDAFIQSGDQTLLRNWTFSNYSSYSGPGAIGKAFAVRLFTPTVDVYDTAGNSVMLKAWTHDNPGVGSSDTTARAGYGIQFEITTQCAGGAANIYGRDATPALLDPTDAYISGPTAYEYSATFTDGVKHWPENETFGGVAAVKLNSGSCANNDTVIIGVYIPSDVEAIPGGQGSLGRFDARLNAAGTITATIHTGVSRSLTGISVNGADPQAVLEGNTTPITATCSYSSAPPTHDCSDP